MELRKRAGTYIVDEIIHDEKYQFMVLKEPSESVFTKSYRYVENVDQLVGGEQFILPVELNQYVGNPDFIIKKTWNGASIVDIKSLKDTIVDRLADAKPNRKNIKISEEADYFELHDAVTSLGYSVCNCYNGFYILNPKFVPKKKSKKFKQPRHYDDRIQECGWSYNELRMNWSFVYNILAGESNTVRFNLQYTDGGNMKEAIAIAKKLGMTKKKFITLVKERMFATPDVVKRLITMYKNPDKYQFIEKPEEK